MKINLIASSLFPKSLSNISFFANAKLTLASGQSR